MLDQFHVVKRLVNEIDAVRATETSLLNAQRKHSVAKRPERMIEKQDPKVAEMLKHNLCSGRAYLMKDDSQHLWDGHSPT